MDVIVDSYGDLKPFLLEVGRFDTVREIKEKIEQLEGIPISKQILCFNDEILPNDFYVGDSGIVDGSTLLLIPATNADMTQPIPAANENRHFLENDDHNLSRLLNDLRFTDSDAASTSIILHGYPIDYLPGDILQCEGVPPPKKPNNPNPLRANLRRFTQRPQPSMRVVVRHNDQETTVPVSREEPVSALRGRLRQRGFRLPDPCFFIHRQRVMEEEQSFESNEVRHGDLIESFSGYVAEAEPDTDSGIDTPSTSVPSLSASSSSSGPWRPATSSSSGPSRSASSSSSGPSRSASSSSSGPSRSASSSSSGPSRAASSSGHSKDQS